MPTAVGVLAVQGDFEKHTQAIYQCNPNIEVVEVRTPEDLDLVGRLIIPGGESTTVGMLLERFGLGQAIRSAAQNGMPIWGTCMGMILMADEVVGREQYKLGILDIAVERNAFGAQVYSFEAPVTMAGLDEPVLGVFIRAPIVTRVGEGVDVLAYIDEKIVAVKQGKLLGTSFHPEMTDDIRLHKWFLAL